MILIFSIDTDNSTNDVIDWIIYKTQKAPARINDAQSIRGNFCLSITQEDQAYITDDRGNKIPFSDIHAVWYRRSFDPVPTNLNQLNPKEISTEIKNGLKNELQYSHHAVHHNLRNKYRINDVFTAKNDKIRTLLAAKDAGLDIPDTIITNKTEELELFLEKHAHNIITKSIYNLPPVRCTGGFYFPKTIKLTKEHLPRNTGNIFPVLAQENIQKQYELRVFILNGKCYPMAIFSQNNKKTMQDFRNYDFENPNRTVPYKLPEDLERKLLVLMQTIELNCGSIDLMKGADGKYYFLEVNPVGQFGMVSYPCNYYIEEKISTLLTEHDR